MPINKPYHSSTSSSVIINIIVSLFGTSRMGGVRISILQHDKLSPYFNKLKR